MTDYRYKPLLSEEDQRILGDLDAGSIGPLVLLHASHPRNEGLLIEPDGEAKQTGICGDSVFVQLSLKGDLVDEIVFTTDGCGFTKACASMATELVRGRPVEAALVLTGERIARSLCGLPREHVHCADLAANAVREAVQQAREKR